MAGYGEVRRVMARYGKEILVSVWLLFTCMVPIFIGIFINIFINRLDFIEVKHPYDAD